MFLVRIIDGINEVIGRIVVLVALAIAGIIIFDVVLRYGFRAPTRWAFDVSTQVYGFYFIMLGGYALRHKSHVRVDLVISLLSRRARRIVDALGYIIFFFPFVYIFVTRAYVFAERSFLQREMTWGAVQLPVYPLKMAMALAAVLLLLQGISELIKILLDKSEPEDVR